MGNKLALLLPGDCDLGPRDDWPSEGGSKKVDILVDRIALDSREAQFSDELVVEFLDVALFCTNFQCLLLCCLEVLFLTDGGHKANNIVALFNKPGDCDGSAHVHCGGKKSRRTDARCVETATVSETDPLFSHDGCKQAPKIRVNVQGEASRRKAEQDAVLFTGGLQHHMAGAVNFFQANAGTNALEGKSVAATVFRRGCTTKICSLSYSAFAAIRLALVSNMDALPSL